MFGVRKLFDEEHSWIKDEINENKTFFIQKEVFTEFLVPLGSRLLRNTQTGFDMMNQALKEEAKKSNAIVFTSFSGD